MSNMWTTFGVNIMSEFEELQQQITQLNNKKIQIQTLADQAHKKCQEIETKYNVSSPVELEALVQKAKQEYEKQVQEAKNYIEETTQIISQYSGII